MIVIILDVRISVNATRCDRGMITTEVIYYVSMLLEILDVILVIIGRPDVGCENMYKSDPLKNVTLIWVDYNDIKETE